MRNIFEFIDSQLGYEPKKPIMYTFTSIGRNLDIHTIVFFFLTKIQKEKRPILYVLVTKQ